MSHVKNIAIVGASGSVGSQIVASLLASPLRFNLTAISRSDSAATFPSTVAVERGSYDSDDFFVEALTGQDVMILGLGFSAPPDLQGRLFKAAIKAGVPWIVPNWWSSDGTHEPLAEAVPLIKAKMEFVEQLKEAKGKSSWVAITNGPWFDYSLKNSLYGIDIASRTATLVSDASQTLESTTLSQVGRAVAALLSLPITSSSPSELSLSYYKNKYIYINSFTTTQVAMLASVQKATGTTDVDWKIKTTTVEEYIGGGWEKIKGGNFTGMIEVLYGNGFKSGVADRFYGRELANEELGLPEEDFDAVVAEVVKSVEAGK